MDALERSLGSLPAVLPDAALDARVRRRAAAVPRALPKPQLARSTAWTRLDGALYTVLVGLYFVYMVQNVAWMVQ